MSRRLAFWVSVVASPPVWIVALLLAMMLRTGLAAPQIELLFPLLVLFMLLIPLAALYTEESFGLISHWDIPNRRERYVISEIVCVSYALALIPTYVLGSPLLMSLMSIVVVILALLTLITHFTKISFHMGINTAGVILINYLYGWQALWLLIILPLVYFARLALRRHTPAQLLAGAGVSALLTLVGLFVAGILTGGM